MRFRQWFFTLLAVIALSWIAWGLSATGSAVSSTSESANVRYETGSLERASATVGIGIGASLSSAVFLCTGLPLLLLFSFLAWRNAVGVREKKRHLEVLQALKHE